MKKFSLLIALLLAAVLFGCGEDKPALPKNELAYENKENTELIPDGSVEEHGPVTEASVGDELPSENELGEYHEIFMKGDYLDGGRVAGWVLAISLKDITVNTYNKITTYILDGNGLNCVDFVKPGDAVLMTVQDGPKGEKFATEVSRVRVEDDPVTQEEMEEQLAGGSPAEDAAGEAAEPASEPSAEEEK